MSTGQPVIYTPVGDGHRDPGKVGVILTDESRSWVVANYTREKLTQVSASDMPRKVDPGDWIPVEDQAQQGSCRGHSGTSCVEMCHYWRTGVLQQFSRQYMYIAAQKKDGIRGDSGSSISGGFKVMLNDGALPESYWPYTGRYHTAPPGLGWSEVARISSLYKVEKIYPIRSFEDAINFLALRIGAIDVGFMWGGSVDEQAARTGVIERWSAGRGGHALGFLGYDTITHGGREIQVLKMWNSWSRRWGKNGTCYWTKDAFEQMISHRWTEIGGVAGLTLGEGAELPNYDSLKFVTF